MKLFYDRMEELRKQFDERYKIGNCVAAVYRKDAPGTLDVEQYPDTEMHRELYPNLYNFEFYGFKCYISRGWANTWCGYVWTENHPCWNSNKNIEDLIDVHGGITMASKSEQKIGFDCHHAWDKEPFVLPKVLEHGQYRDRSYVVNELKSVCEQLFNMLPEWSPSTHKQFPKKLQEKYFELYQLWYLRKQSEDFSKITQKDIWINIVSQSIKSDVTSQTTFH